MEAPSEALCLGCNYPLRGLPESRCPECGRVFDPREPWTMNAGRPMGRVASFWFSPVGWPTYLAASAATAAVFWWTAALPSASLAMELSLLSWLAIYAYRLARLIARRIIAAIYRQ